MKSKHRFTCVVWLLKAMFLTSPVVAQAQFTYTTSGTVTITGYTGTGGEVNIPASIDNVDVTRIANYAFAGKTNITSVTIPGSVSSIGNQAFSRCYGLTNVTISNGVVNVNSFAFEYCTNLITVTIPASVTFLGSYAFRDCGIASVSIPSSASIISAGTAFYQCSRMTNVTISGGVTSIGPETFQGCISLRNVSIPGSVTSIGNSAFGYCVSLVAISVDATNASYSSVDGVLFDKNKNTLVEYPGGKGEDTYTIPTGVLKIGEEAFRSCVGLTNVIIPGSVTNIGSAAFLFCNNLRSVYCQGNAPSADWNTFFGVSSGTVYYLLGTRDWDSTLGGLPTALWNPAIQTTAGSLGIQTNQFGFNINWASGQTVVVEAATNLTSPVWLPVSTNTLTSGSSFFNDPQWTNYPDRFYRLRSP